MNPMFTAESSLSVYLCVEFYAIQNMHSVSRPSTSSSLLGGHSMSWRSDEDEEPSLLVFICSEFDISVYALLSASSF